MRHPETLPQTDAPRRRRGARAMVVGFAVLVSMTACGGGGDGTPTPPSAAPPPSPYSANQPSLKAAPTALRGMPNDNGTCFINAPLQVILNRTALREDLERLHPTGPFADFFSAYDNPAISDAEFDLRRAAVVQYLRNVANQSAHTLGSDTYIPSAGAADSAQAMSVMLGRSTFAADYPANSPYIEMDLFEAEKVQLAAESDTDAMFRAAQMHFDAGKRVFGHANLIDYPTMMRIAANANATVTGFSYYINAHFIAYVRKDDRWWMIDDHAVRQASESEVRTIPYELDLHVFTTTGKGSGISTFALE